MNQGNNLETLFNVSYPSNHLLIISVVKDNTPNVRNKYYSFITLLPRSTDMNGNVTYDKNARVTLKQNLHHLRSLAKSIKRTIKYIEKPNLIGQTSIFSDGSKSSFGDSIKKVISVNLQANQNGQPVILIMFKAGDAQAKAISLSPSEAEAMADEIELVCNKALEMAIVDSSWTPTTAQQSQYNQPPQNTGFTPNSFQNQTQSTPQFTPQEQSVDQTPPNQAQFVPQGQPATQTPQSTQEVQNVSNNFQQLLNKQNTDVPF